MDGKAVKGFLVHEIKRNIYGKEVCTLPARCGSTSGYLCAIQDGQSFYIALYTLTENGGEVHLFFSAENVTSTTTAPSDAVEPLNGLMLIQRLSLPVIESGWKQRAERGVVEKMLFSGKSILNCIDYGGTLFVLKTGLITENSDSESYSDLERDGEDDDSSQVDRLDHVQDFDGSYHPSVHTAYTAAVVTGGIVLLSYQEGAPVKRHTHAGSFRYVSCEVCPSADRLFVVGSGLDGSVKVFGLEDTLSCVKEIMMGPQCHFSGITSLVLNTELHFSLLLGETPLPEKEEEAVVLRGRDGRPLVVEDSTPEPPLPSPLLSHMVARRVTVNEPPTTSLGLMSLQITSQGGEPVTIETHIFPLSDPYRDILRETLQEGEIRLGTSGAGWGAQAWGILFTSAGCVLLGPLRKTDWYYAFRSPLGNRKIVGCLPHATGTRLLLLHGDYQRHDEGAVVALITDLKISSVPLAKVWVHPKNVENNSEWESLIRRVVREEVDRAQESLRLELREIRHQLSQLLDQRKV